MDKSQQKRAATLEQWVQDLLKGVHEKEGLAATLLRLAQEERQLISLLPIHVKQLTCETYRPFLHQESYLLFKITNKENPIWLSDNLQLANISTLGSFEGTLTSNVHQMHDNLAKYESVIASLKELKEMEQLQKEQDERSKGLPNRELKLKKYIQTLQKQIFQAKSQIQLLTKEKTDLQSAVTLLKEKEKQNQERRDLQIRFKECNNADLSDQPKRRHKKILINY